MNVTDLREAIKAAEYHGVKWNGIACQAGTVVVQDAQAAYVMTGLHDARDSIVAFLSAPPFEDGKPVNKARLEWLAADYVVTT